MKIDTSVKLDPVFQGARHSISAGKDSGFKAILEGVRREKDDKKLQAACQEIEALFIYEMLKQMRSSIPKGGLIPEGIGEGIYKDMLDEEYSKIIAASPGRLGLADLLYRQLKRDKDGKIN